MNKHIEFSPSLWVESIRGERIGVLSVNGIGPFTEKVHHSDCYGWVVEYVHKILYDSTFLLHALKLAVLIEANMVPHENSIIRKSRGCRLSRHCRIKPAWQVKIKQWYYKGTNHVNGELSPWSTFLR